MEKVRINQLEEDSMFHFTLRDQLDQIEEKGLLPIIGENAAGIERTPKVFFSKGELGILKATEVWLRWLMNRTHGVVDKLGLYKGLSKEEDNIRLGEWTKEFLSKEFLNDEEKKEILFDYYYEYLKKRIYLYLDIEDKVEYDSNDVDENKVLLQERNEYLPTAFATVMYGDFSDMNNPIMDDWNMHTKSGTGIEPDKIKQVVTPNEEESCLSIIMYLYDKYKDMDHEHLLLDDFIEFAKKKEMIDSIKEEGNEDDKDNYCR